MLPSPDADHVGGGDAAPLLERLREARTWARREPQRGAWPDAGEPVRRRYISDELERATPRLLADGGAYVHCEHPAAVERAISRARELGLPLAGMTFAVKDNIAVAGRPLRAASAARDDARPEPCDAPVVERMKAAGAALCGTVTLHELASGVTGLNAFAGTPKNPAAPDCVPGGSSSGSAIAVADGSVDVALGTDTGGSCRIPAAFCAVVGFKPAFGVYPMTGVLPLAPSFDCVGLLARRTIDIAAAHEALAAPTPPPQLPAVVGFAPAQLEDAESEIGGRLEALLASLALRGCRIVETPWPHGEEVFAVGTTIFFAEAAARFGHLATDDGVRLGDDIRGRLLAGLAIPAVDYVGAMEHRHQLRRQALASLTAVDCVVGPTVPILPPPLDGAISADRTPDIVANTRLANITGLPALSIPSPRHPPSGIQLTAADDARTIAYGAAIEALLLEDELR